MKNLGEVSLLAFVKEPWNLASTQALAVNPSERYVLVKAGRREYYIVALERIGELGARLGRNDLQMTMEAPGEGLYEFVLEHPLFPQKDIPIVPDETISPSYGSGINLITPLASLHDLEIAERYHLDIESYLSRHGTFTSDLGGEFENLNPFKQGNELITELMEVKDCIVTSYEYEYEFTRIKETKERVLLNSLDSWFFDVSDSLKHKCLQELAFTKFRPKLNIKDPSQVDEDYEKLRQDEKANLDAADVDAYYFNVVEELNDFNEWCISEKSYWGIPIPYFFNKVTKQVLTNQEIVLHVAKIFKEQGGSDAWYKLPVIDLLPDAYKEQANNLVKGDEVFDVWFDNSLTWKTILHDKANEDEELLSQAEKLDGMISQTHPEYRTQSSLEEDLKQLIQSKGGRGRGRRSLAKLNQQRKEREAIIQKYNEDRNQYLSKIDIDTFKSMIPSSTIWKESEIKGLIERKTTSVNKNKDLTPMFPANLVVEGYDQHIRWFLTSTLTSVALTSTMPFQTIKTHGIIFDEEGNKMSKSLNNYIDPTDIIEGTKKLSGEREYGFGVDVLRLWSAIMDSDKALTIDNHQLQEIQKELKMIRQILRLILGHLHDYDVNTQFNPDELSLMDKLVLLKTHEYVNSVGEAYENLGNLSLPHKGY